MSIPKSVHASVEASRAAPDFSVNEDAGRLVVVGRLPRPALAAWQRVVDEGAPWLTVRCIDASDDEVAPGQVRDGDAVRLTVTYEPQEGAAHLFTPEGWRFFLLDDARASKTTVARLAFIGVAEGFATRAFPVEPWADTPEPGPPQDPRTELGPRRQVRSQSPDLMAPTRIEPYVSVMPDLGGPAAEIWRQISSALIARSLPNELYRDGVEGRAMLSGQPPRKLALGSHAPDDDAFKVQQGAATWVYLEGSDVEVRHTFLSAELSREWSADVSFCAGLPARLAPALDSARLLYKAHLRSGSKDTLKALSDLRKTLSDDVGKLLAQSRDLSSTVWRDVAVAVGAMAVRFAVDSTKAPAAATGFVWVFLAVAVYVVASYRMTVSTNRRFLDIVEESRMAWRTKLYGFLDDPDYRALAEKPIIDALAAYRRTQLVAARCVAAVTLLLLLGAAVDAGWVDPAAPFAWLKGASSGPGASAPAAVQTGP